MGIRVAFYSFGGHHLIGGNARKGGTGTRVKEIGFDTRRPKKGRTRPFPVA